MGLLGDLALRALGQEPPGAARLVLPPRFAPPGNGVPLAVVLPDEGSTPDRISETAGVHVTASPAPSLSGERVEVAAAIGNTVEAAGSEVRSPSIPARIDLTGSSAPRPVGLPTSQRPVDMIASGMETPAGGQAAPTLPAGAQPARSIPAIGGSGLSEPYSAPAAIPAVAAAPLSAAALAERVPVPGPQALPALHVEIGSIEVRAPVAPTSVQPPRRQRPAAVSLSDYLGGRR